MVLSVNFSNFGFHWLYECLRCCDRGCMWSSKYTKQLTQVDYEDKNTYFDYDMMYRYCNLLTVIFVCFMYSSGIPILYPLACVYFGLIYICDKYMLFRWYKKPPVLDGHIALNTLEWFKYAMVFHVVFGAIMYSSSEILNTRESAAFVQENFKEAIDGYNLGQFLQLHVVIFVGTFLALFVVWLLWKVFFKLCWKKICSKKDAEDAGFSSSLHYTKS